jgi:hypothetical protein
MLCSFTAAMLNFFVDGSGVLVLPMADPVDRLAGAVLPGVDAGDLLKAVLDVLLVTM